MAVVNDFASEERNVQISRICRVLEVPRSTAYYEARERARPARRAEDDGTLAMLIYEIIQAHPYFGIRRVWAYLRFNLDWPVNRKRVARIMRENGWSLRRRRVGGRPRVQFMRSVADRINERWATDIAMVFCGPQDGWCAVVPVLDCYSREVLGWELSHTARAKTAERALEQALINRFGWTGGASKDLTIRHDNGLVFGSRLYCGCAREYGLKQEFITPYTPEDNGLAERFIRSMKEECVWQHRFSSIEEARKEISNWIKWYNEERPHQALGYKTPRAVALAALELAA